MKLHKLLFFALILSIFSCETTKEKADVSTSEDIKTENSFEFGVWITANKERANEDYAKEFEKYKSAGIDEVLINTGTDPELLKRITPIH